MRMLGFLRLQETMQMRLVRDHACCWGGCVVSRELSERAVWVFHVRSPGGQSIHSLPMCFNHMELQEVSWVQYGAARKDHIDSKTGNSVLACSAMFGVYLLVNKQSLLPDKGGGVWWIHYLALIWLCSWKGCSGFISDKAVFIGASLDKPHTSMTALRTCVCIYVCLSVCGHIPKILNERVWILILRRSHSVCDREAWRLKVYRRFPGVELTEIEVHMATYSRQQVTHRQYKFDHNGGWGCFR